MPLGFHFRIFLDLKGRGVTVACHDPHSLKRMLRYGKCDQGGIIAGHIVRTALLKIPVHSLFQSDKAGLCKPGSHGTDCMKSSRAFLDKFD